MKKSTFILFIIFIGIVQFVSGQSKVSASVVNIGGSIRGEENENRTKNVGETGGSRV